MTTIITAPASAAPLHTRAVRAALPRTPALVLTDLCKTYGKTAKRAVDGLNLRIEPGEIFGLLGPNGSGKSTTMNLLLGLLAPTSGSIEVLGRDAGCRRVWGCFTTHPNQRWIRQRVGFVPQETALYAELTARENLAFHADLYGVPRHLRHRRIRNALKLAGLLEVQQQRVKTFSGGMQRRLALVRALLHDPDLLVLDEPTLGVDVQSRQLIWGYIRELRGRGKTVLLTTNQMEEAQALCSRVAIIDHGTLQVVDTVEHLTEQYGSGVLEVETAQVSRQVGRLRLLPGVTAVYQEARCLRVLAQGMTSQFTAQVLSILGQEGEVTRFHVHTPTLDEIFLQLTGAGLRD